RVGVTDDQISHERGGEDSARQVHRWECRASARSKVFLNRRPAIVEGIRRRILLHEWLVLLTATGWNRNHNQKCKKEKETGKNEDPVSKSQHRSSPSVGESDQPESEVRARYTNRSSWSTSFYTFEQKFYSLITEKNAGYSHAAGDWSAVA